MVLEACRDTKAEGVVKRLEDFVKNFGAPERIVTDRGTCFTSTKFTEFCEEHGIHHTLNSSRHAQANGQVERVNRTLIPVLQAISEQEDNRDWDRRLKEVAVMLNTLYNKTTDTTPFEMLYGYPHRFREGPARIFTQEEVAHRYQRPEEIQAAAREEILVQQAKYKDFYDKSRYHNVFYNLGDIVYMKTVPIATGQSTKLQVRYRGPLVIYKVLPQLKQWKHCIEDAEQSDKDSDEDAEIEETNQSEVSPTVDPPEATLSAAETDESRDPQNATPEMTTATTQETNEKEIGDYPEE